MFRRYTRNAFLCTILPWLMLTASAQTAANRYTLILEDPPVAERFKSSALRTTEAVSYREQIAEKQKALKEELARQKFQVTGSVSTLLNAVFVIAPKERVDELKNLPGVKAVLPGRRFHRNLNQATQLLNAPAAWNVLGGIQKAGSGMKIAILDSGIDQTHPALQDNTLTMPSGFPICSGSDCAWTNSKVIVARSYVKQLAAGSADSPAADSRPDDYSPRDRDGHGTAVASCVAGNLNTGLVTFSGIAPKAWLGNYKIYGSPGVNDGTTDDVIVQALEDAYQDGMDVINFSSGGPAFSGPLDTGSVCGTSPGAPCDLVAQTVETLARKGIIIVAAAGNEGNDGVSSTMLGYSTIGSPANAPSAIAVGAATNSHTFAEVAGATDPAAPSNVQNIVTDPGDAPVPTGAVAGKLVDVTALGDDGYACSALPAGSLVGAIALIERNNCTFSTKVSNAEDAGARAVILYMADASALVAPSGLSNSGIPAAMIANSSGLALKAYASANPGGAIKLDGAGMEQQGARSGEVTIFSSVGPTTGDAALKPDVVGIGESVYMAGETYDINGALFSANRYVVADGTSFSTPMIAGAAALVKQQHPNWTAAQVKSALVNTAATIQSDEAGNSVDNRSFGGGLLDAGSAVNASVTANPSNLSFGAIGSSSLPKTLQVQLTNSGPTRASLTISVTSVVSNTRASVGVDRSSLTLEPNETGTINVALTGSVPGAGAYSGNVVVQGSGVSLHIPYLYLVPSGTSANLIPLTGSFFDGTVGSGIADGFLSFLLVDATGLPVTGAPVSFGARGGTIQNADSTTDRYGIATAVPVLGLQPGNVTFTATAGGLRYVYSGFARPRPTTTASGITNAASGQSGAVAPGSYIAIYGSGLSDFSDYAQSATLPIAIDQAFVSFDVPSAGISVPGHLTYVSPGQVNVQVPWELQGQSSAQMKITIDYSYGNVVTLSLAGSAPAVFQGGGIAAARDQQNAVITTGNPARRGQVVQLFANGLGPVSNQPASGEPAGSSPLATTTTVPTVTIGGQPAPVMFSGLAPGFAGLYQVNVTVPSGLSPGMQAVSIAIGGATSPSVNLPVQ